MNIGAVVACSASCLSRIPWWVWFVLVLAGAAIGAISYLAGLLLAGVGGVVVSALLTAMILGALGGVATRFCIAFWAAFRKVESFDRAIADELTST